MGQRILDMPVLIEEFLSFEEKYKIGCRSSRKSRRDRLTGNLKRKTTVAELLAKCGIHSTEDITRDRIHQFYEKLERLIPDDDYRSAITGVVRRMLKWAMKDNIITEDELLLSLLKQKLKFRSGKRVPSAQQLKHMEKYPICKDPFLAFEMFFVIAVLFIRLALRPGKEIENLNVEDFDRENKILWVTRKRNRRRPVYLSNRLIRIFRLFLWMRHLYLKKHGVKNVKALIIKQADRLYGKTKRSSWRLKKTGLYARVRNYKKKYLNSFGDINLYDFRRLSVSVQSKVARIMKMAIEDLAFKNDHSRKVFNESYNVFADDKSIMLENDIHENMELTKKLCNDSFKCYQSDNTKIEHLASSKRWFDLMGDFQNEIDFDKHSGNNASRCSFGFHSAFDNTTAGRNQIRNAVGLPEKEPDQVAIKGTHIDSTNKIQKIRCG